MGLFDRGRKRGQSSAHTGQAVADLGFEARCPAGHEFIGTRQELFQAIRCPECGEGIFILPTTWLPVPPMASVTDLIPLGEIRKQAVPQKEDPDDQNPDNPTDPPDSAHRPPKIPLREPTRPTARKPDSMPVDDPAARYQVESAGAPDQAEFERMIQDDADRQSSARMEGHTARTASPSKRPKSARPVPAKPDATVEDPENDPEFDHDEEIAEDYRPPFYQRISRTVWIGLGVTAIMGLTVFFQIRQSHREQLPRLANLGRTEGIAKLDSGQFDEAKQILAEAASAYDEMNDQSDEARSIRQAARESAIFADLVSRPIDEIIDSVAADATGRSEFLNQHRGRSIIIESRVTKTPQQGGQYDLDFRAAVGPGPDSARPLGRLDLAGLKLLDDLKPGLGDSVLIGVRLKDLELKDGLWWIRLEPSSGVMITHWNALSAIGWPVTDRAKPSSPNTEANKP